MPRHDEERSPVFSPLSLALVCGGMVAWGDLVDNPQESCGDPPH
jgi:hypothetical protein